MRLVFLCAIFLFFVNLSSEVVQVPDTQLIINSDGIMVTSQAAEPPARWPTRNGIGACKIKHEKEKSTYPGKKYILRKQVTVLIIVDAQKDFSDDYPNSTLPVPGTKEVISVINWIRKQGESWFGWKSSFAAVFRTEDTHPDDHISFATSKYWQIQNMKPNNTSNYQPPAARSAIVFSLGCKVKDSTWGALTALARHNGKKPTDEPSASSSSSSSNNNPPPLTTTPQTQPSTEPTAPQPQLSTLPTAPQTQPPTPPTAPVDDQYDMTRGINADTDIDPTLYLKKPLSNDESYIFPQTTTISMAIWPKHCVAGTEGAESNTNLVTRKDDVVIPKGYYTFRESLEGQVDCDTDEELYRMAVVNENGTNKKIIIELSAVAANQAVISSFDRINLRKYLDDMENPLESRGPSRAKGLVIQTLIITGFAFEFCVTQTALSLASIEIAPGIKRYNVIIVADGVGYLLKYDDRADTRRKLQLAGIKIVDHQDLVFV